MGTVETTVVVDGHEYVGTLTVEQERIFVGSDRATKPDPSWEFVDKAGHWHAFAMDGELPTLERYEKRVPHDGSCGGVCEGEGTVEVRYRCRACGKRVRPAWVPDEAARTATMPGRQSWSVTIKGVDPPGPPGGSFGPGAKASVRVDFGLRTYFGIAAFCGGLMDVSGWWSLELAGVSELGQRWTPIRRPAETPGEAV